jgi:arabinofuranan 3-O-arabinosyltransferase
MSLRAASTLDARGDPGPVGNEPVAPEGPTADRRSLERLWLATTMLALALAVFSQSAGNAAADTKLDLVVSPLRFLGRALRLWDPTGNAGQLQNQAYGYLFPIGPFYAVLHAMGVAPWEMQRAFESVLVALAFLGTYRLSRRMGVDAFWPALGAGLVYALAPRVLSELTSISAELMPVAVLPWVMIPLVDGAAGGSPRRAAARSGVALLFAGGVNAAATVAILPVPALWLLTRARGSRRNALAGWWALAVALACAWWALPLVLLGRYSPPFLDWVESSSTTTIPTSLLAVLRGVDHWLAYLGPGVWPGGWILVAGRAAIVATTAVAAIGLVGLSRRRVPHALFLWSCLLLGLVVITLGHAAAVGPPGAGAWRELLDGPLVPFRNIHKFDPLVRLPIALGFGHVLLRLAASRDPVRAVRGAPVRLPRRLVGYALVVAIGAVAVAPIWTNHLVSKQRVTPVASWWSSTAEWLGAHAHGARALVVPGSASPVYLWGGTVDDAIQPLAATPWTVRGAVPLTQAGYIRLLDSVEATLAGGAGDPDLAPLLSRAGIGYVVLANDLDTLDSQSTPLVYVRAALENSPGIHLRAGFGQPVGGSLSPYIALDAGGSVARPAVQIYSVDGSTGRAALQPLSSAVRATGSSDALPQLVERGLDPGQAVLFGADGGDLAVGSVVTTDGIRRREASFAGSLTPSATMTQGATYTQARPQHDYLPDHPGTLSAYRYEGIADVSASSSGADGLAFLNRSQANGPWSALDADPRSAWQSTGLGAVGQWLEVRFDHPVTTATVQVRFGVVDDGPAPLATKVTVTTDTGTATESVLPSTAPQQLRLPRGPTSRLRVTIAEVADRSRGSSVAIADLAVPGVSPVRTLVVPSRRDSQMFAFDTASGFRSRCLQLAVGTVCDPVYGAVGQEDSGLNRTFTAAAGDYRAAATVRLAGGPGLDALLDAGNPTRASASSVGSTDPRQRPGAAVDGDPGTIWQAAQGDINPVLTLRLPGPREVTGLTLRTPATAPVAVPLAVTVSLTRGKHLERWAGDLPADGHVELGRAVRANRISIRIDRATVRTSAASVANRSRLLAVGIGEAEVDGVPRPEQPSTVHVACGSGPTLDVDGRVIRLRIDAARSDVLAGRPVDAVPCGQQPLPLAAGEHRVDLSSTDLASPSSVTVSRVGFRLGQPGAPGNLRITYWRATDRAVRVDTAARSLLVVHENANPGWRATLDGRGLRPVRVDGWEQAFVVPAGASGTVVLRFAPQRSFEVALVVGIVAALALVCLAAIGSSRPARPADPPSGDAGPPSALLLGGLVVAGGLLTGWAGVVIVAAVCVAVVLVGPSLRPWSALVAGGVLVVAGVVVSRAGQTRIFAEQNSGRVQLLCLAAIAIGAVPRVLRLRSRRDV